MKCATPYCTGPRDRGKFCYKCISRKYRAKNPVKASFNNHKSNAKRRKIPCELTFEQFAEFCVKTDYLNGCGRMADSFHIDRIDESKGYTIDNIQKIKNSENIKKSIIYRMTSKGPVDFKVVKHDEPDFSDCPY